MVGAIQELKAPQQLAQREPSLDAAVQQAPEVTNSSDIQPINPLESLHETVAEPSFDQKRKAFTNKYGPMAYLLSSVNHVAAASLLLGGANKDSPWVKGATWFTKAVNSLIYGDLSIDAWKGKNTFDFISKILEPFLNCFSQLSNYHLLRGLGSAMTQLHIVNLPHIDKNKNHWENFIENLQQTKKFFVEAWTSSILGPKRKLFKFAKDEGHTLAAVSHVQAAAGIIGLINGSRRNIIDKFVGTVRNIAGIFVDFELLWRKDKDEKLTGLYYIAHAVFDTLKRFLPEHQADILDNMIMPLYNGAMYHFGKITRKQSDGTYVSSVDNNKAEKTDTELKEVGVDV